MGEAIISRRGGAGKAKVQIEYVSPRTSLANLSVGRYYFAAATDGNGNVLFGGGFTGGYGMGSDVVDKYAPDGTHTVITSLSEARYRLGAATDGNGNVLFGGGISGYNSDGHATVDKYTPDGTHTTLANLSVGRSAVAATDGNGNVLFCGGGGYNIFKRTYTYYDIVDKYAPDGTHTTLANLSHACTDHAAATDGNGNVLFGGGQSMGQSSYIYYDNVDKYAPNGTHTTLANLATVRTELAAATDGNGNVLFGGGHNGGTSSSSNSYPTVIDKYAPDGTHTTLESVLEGLLAGRRGLAAATDGNGNVLFGGGMGVEATGTTIISTVDKYTPNGTHIVSIDLAEPRAYLAAATDGNGDVLFGGGSSLDDSGFSVSVDKYSSSSSDFLLPNNILLPRGSDITLQDGTQHTVTDAFESIPLSDNVSGTITIQYSSINIA